MSVPAAYIGVVLIWSTTPLAIQWSSLDVGYLFGVSARMVISLVLCLAIIALWRVRFPWHSEARHVYFLSSVGTFGAMISVYWGAQFISSGLVAVIYGALPMVTALISALILKKEDVWRVGKIAGMVIGMLGLIIVFDPSVPSHPDAWKGVLAVFVSTVLHSFSMVLIKRTRVDIPPLSVVAGGLMIAVPLYLLTAFATGVSWPEEIPSRAMASILYLGVIGSVIGFVLFYYLLKHLNTPSISMITLITPVFALTLGALVNNEMINLTIISGTVLILLGLVVHQWGDTFLSRYSRNG